LDLVAGGGEATAVGAECYARNRRLVSEECHNLLAGRGIPDPDGVIPTARGEAAAVGAEGHSPALVRIDHVECDSLNHREREGFPPRGDVPDLHRAVGAGGGETPAVRAEGHLQYPR